MCDEGFDCSGDIGGGEDTSSDIGSDIGSDDCGDLGGDTDLNGEIDTDTSAAMDADLGNDEIGEDLNGDSPNENESDDEQKPLDNSTDDHDAKDEDGEFGEKPPEFDFSDDAINNVNERLGNQGFQLADISNADVGDLEDNFWYSGGKRGGTLNEGVWEDNMRNYPEILDRINQGQSLEDIRQDENLRCACDTLFGYQHIDLDTSDPYNITVSNGRHRIAMAQRLGYTHLPLPIKK